MIDTFGLGYVFGRRTDIANPTPSYLGIAQSMDLELKQTLKELMGQFRYAVDVAGAEQKITGKIKFARWQALLFNDMLLAGSPSQTVTTGTGRQISVVLNGLPETHTAGASITVTNAATFAEDLGVFYQTTTPSTKNGSALTRVASGPAVGSYAVNEATGVYTFNASETGTLQFFYEYTVTTQTQVAVVNSLMGYLPPFEMHYQHYYTNIVGTTNTLHIKFNACRSSGITMPFKNADFAMLDFSFEAFADPSGNVFTMDFTE